MRVLLDENLDWRLERYLPGHTVESAQAPGWAGLKNGKLLARAESEFDAFITIDKGIGYQQNIAKLDLIVVSLRARSNRLQDTAPFMSQVVDLLPTLKSGTITIVGITD